MNPLWTQIVGICSWLTGVTLAVHLRGELPAIENVAPKVVTAAAEGPTGNQHRKIPAQLVYTAKDKHFEKIPPDVQNNINRTIELNHDLRVRWFDDQDCLEYIKLHYDNELAKYFVSEKLGMFRGDMCRAAVLAKEGGFYLDLDAQIREPLSSLVEADTTFMSAVAEHDGLVILNAILASAPGDAIMRESMEQMRKRYRSNEEPTYLGPEALADAFQSVHDRDCMAEEVISGATPRWVCGSEVVRLYQERSYSCWPPDPDRPPEDCPAERALGMMGFEHAAYGIFMGSKLIGWPRLAECGILGCDAGGHDYSSR